MSKLFLIRARLKRNAAIAAIAPLLLPAEASVRAMAAHRLVWSLFAGDAAQRRNFLWREDTAGTFYILACERPGSNEIFDVDAKEFAPNLASGDGLEFSLRANATRAIKSAGRTRRGKRADVVMAELHTVEQRLRAAARPEAIARAGAAWLATQSARHGFEIVGEPRIDGYETLKIPRDGARSIQISTLDFDGMLRVTEPASFIAAITRGFGHAKAFGCGLMLIRRAR